MPRCAEYGSSAVHFNFTLVSRRLSSPPPFESKTYSCMDQKFVGDKSLINNGIVSISVVAFWGSELM